MGCFEKLVEKDDIHPGPADLLLRFCQKVVKPNSNSLDREVGKISITSLWDQNKRNCSRKYSNMISEFVVSHF